jgi:hypothetical protein
MRQKLRRGGCPRSRSVLQAVGAAARNLIVGMCHEWDLYDYRTYEDRAAKRITRKSPGSNWSHPWHVFAATPRKKTCN